MSNLNRIIPLPDEVKEEFQNFLQNAESLTRKQRTYQATLIDPEEYMIICNICNYPDGDHSPNCLIGILEEITV